MSDEQSGHFTLINLFWELFHVALIAVGCYAGWKAGEHFLTLFAGGVVGRIAGLTIVLGLRSMLGVRPEV